MRKILHSSFPAVATNHCVVAVIFRRLTERMTKFKSVPKNESGKEDVVASISIPLNLCWEVHEIYSLYTNKIIKIKICPLCTVTSFLFSNRNTPWLITRNSKQKELIVPEMRIFKKDLGIMVKDTPFMYNLWLQDPRIWTIKETLLLAQSTYFSPHF